ncbi:hypothetical protein NIES2101_36730 [Calothrix sp. HK-06]|nr:hypothetical protein NIES2101_36730 [Calothrix sp. HK-06]
MSLQAIDVNFFENINWGGTGTPNATGYIDTTAKTIEVIQSEDFHISEELTSKMSNVAIDYRNRALTSLITALIIMGFSTFSGLLVG